MISDKIKSREELVSIVTELKRQGKKIVFTNGCFDLLHMGHFRYLTEAKQHGDVLIVAANTDEMITRLKGPERPIFSEEERQLILAAIEAVDYVTLFHEETPHRILNELKPDVLIKGGDYDVDGIVGHELVWSWGGEVKPLVLTPGASTRKVIQKILSRHKSDSS